MWSNAEENVNTRTSSHYNTKFQPIYLVEPPKSQGFLPMPLPIPLQRGFPAQSRDKLLFPQIVSAFKRVHPINSFRDVMTPLHESYIRSHRRTFI